MITRTRAIVLHLAKYSDKASIAHLYTREYGRVNCMVYRLGSRKGKLARGMFQPLSIIEADADFDSDRMPVLAAGAVNNIKTIAYNDITHNSIMLFLSELLYKTLQHPLSDERLFDWIEGQVAELDSGAVSPNMHIRFMIVLGQYLGIMPETEENDIPVTRSERQTALDRLCKYYMTHIDGFTYPRSLDMLKTIFD